jgi:hypothetical protein
LIFTKFYALGGGENPGSPRHKACTWCQRITGFFSIFDRARVYCSTAAIREISQAKKARAAPSAANLSAFAYEFFMTFSPYKKRIAASKRKLIWIGPARDKPGAVGSERRTGSL